MPKRATQSRTLPARKPPAKRRVVDRIAGAFVLLPAGFGALCLMLDLAESHVRGWSDIGGPLVLSVGVAVTAALEVWFRTEDRWARRRLLARRRTLRAARRRCASAGALLKP